MATEKAEIPNYEDLQRAGTERRYQSLAIYKGPTPLYVWLVLSHPVSLFSNRFRTIYILKQKLLITLADIFFPWQSLHLSALQILSCVQGRAVNPRTPEHSGVNYSTPELFWD